MKIKSSAIDSVTIRKNYSSLHPPWPEICFTLPRHYNTVTGGPNNDTTSQPSLCRYLFFIMIFHSPVISLRLPEVFVECVKLCWLFSANVEPVLVFWHRVNISNAA